MILYNFSNGLKILSGSVGQISAYILTMIFFKPNDQNILRTIKNAPFHQHDTTLSVAGGISGLNKIFSRKLTILKYESVAVC